jgi:hypothetical protein
MEVRRLNTFLPDESHRFKTLDGPRVEGGILINTGFAGCCSSRFVAVRGLGGRKVAAARVLRPILPAAMPQADFTLGGGGWCER